MSCSHPNTTSVRFNTGYHGALVCSRTEISIVCDHCGDIISVKFHDTSHNYEIITPPDQYGTVERCSKCHRENY